MFALIDEDNNIVDISATEFPITSGLSWIVCADDTTTRDSIVDGKVVKYVPAEETTQQKINDLERLETPRRMAEAVLTQDGKDWLQINRNAIAVERQNL